MQVVTSAATVEKALALIDAHAFDVALLDMNLGSSGNRVDESNGKCGLKRHGYWVFEVS